MRRILLAGATLAVAAVAWAADPPKAPLSANTVVELRGRISRVDAFQPGQGMPSLTVDVNGSATSVVLGSMRYLMEQNFNPKAGMEVLVRGYKLPNTVVAIEVKLPATNQSIKLRDEDGWPLWRGRSGHGKGGGDGR